MNKTDYMNRLKAEMNGFPGHLIEESLWTYEAKFVDGLQRGMTEEAICLSLPSPMSVAEQVRKQFELQQLKNKLSPSNILRFIFTFLGLMILNIFMLIPSIIFSALNLISYISSAALYTVGIFMAAISLSGISVLDMDVPNPVREHQIAKYGQSYPQSSVVIRVTPMGLISMNARTQEIIHVGNEQLNRAHVQVRNETTPAQTWIGALIVLAGIAFSLISLMLTRFGFMLLKTYLRWNLNCLLGRSSTSTKN
jgi:uncharacterized membrane protein